MHAILPVKVERIEEQRGDLQFGGYSMSRPGFTLYQLIVTEAPIGIIFANRDGIIELWNPAAEAVFGYNSEEAVGQSLNLIIPKDLREAHWKGYRAAMASGQTKYNGQLLATRSRHKDGRKIYVELAFGVIKDGSRQVLGGFAVARDITERYKKEKSTQKE
jgi:PAS domain S-box-containing protein